MTVAFRAETNASWLLSVWQADNGLGLNYLPSPIYDEFCDEERFGPLERVRQAKNKAKQTEPTDSLTS